MEKKQSEIEAKLDAEIMKNHPTRANVMSGHFNYDDVFKLMQQAYNLDRESPPVMPKHAGNRFEIENSGTPFLAFETEAHIIDDQNPGCAIIVKSGYSTLEETDEYANKILKILNNGSL